MRGPEWNGDAAARCRRQRSMEIGEFPQQAENRFRVTKALLAEEFDALTKRLIDAKISLIIMILLMLLIKNTSKRRRTACQHI